jgi:hypothetical protein
LSSGSAWASARATRRRHRLDRGFAVLGVFLDQGFAADFLFDDQRGEFDFHGGLSEAVLEFYQPRGGSAHHQYCKLDTVPARPRLHKIWFSAAMRRRGRLTGKRCAGRTYAPRGATIYRQLWRP